MEPNEHCENDSFSPNEDCEFAVTFVRAHRFLHMTMEALQEHPECFDQHDNAANQLHENIVNVINEASLPNGIKLLALYYALIAGVECMEKREAMRGMAN